VLSDDLRDGSCLGTVADVIEVNVNKEELA
jgi:hypothetical protein